MPEELWTMTRTLRFGLSFACCSRSAVTYDDVVVGRPPCFGSAPPLLAPAANGNTSTAQAARPITRFLPPFPQSALERDSPPRLPVPHSALKRASPRVPSFRNIRSPLSALCAGRIPRGGGP